MEGTFCCVVSTSSGRQLNLIPNGLFTLFLNNRGLKIVCILTSMMQKCSFSIIPHLCALWTVKDYLDGTRFADIQHVC